MPVFTAETARIAAKLSHAPTSARNRPAIQSLPEPQQTQPAANPADDGYSLQVLTRTRRQLDLVAERILEELQRNKPDSRRLRDLSDAQRHLAEQERILAGRPMPGSLRPSSSKSNSRQSPGAWLESPVRAPASDTPTGSVPPAA